MIKKDMKQLIWYSYPSWRPVKGVLSFLKAFLRSPILFEGLFISPNHPLWGLFQDSYPGKKEQTKSVKACLRREKHGERRRKKGALSCLNAFLRCPIHPIRAMMNNWDSGHFFYTSQNAVPEVSSQVICSQKNKYKFKFSRTFPHSSYCHMQYLI